MNKEYFITKTSFWFLARIAIYVLGVILSYKHIYIIFLIDFAVHWIVKGVDPIEHVKSYWSVIQDILFKKGGVSFVLGISEEGVKTKDGEYLYSEIKSYKTSRGGSEPYLLLKTGRRIDLNISWLKKAEQKEIAKSLQERIPE